MALSADQLIPLLDASSLLDQVEAGLRRVGKKTAADQLLRLQEDAGIDAAKVWGVYHPEAGPRTVGLTRHYQEVTATRFNFAIRTAAASLPESDLQRTLVMLTQRILVPESAVEAGKQARTHVA